jgi:hypothetical protein
MGKRKKRLLICMGGILVGAEGQWWYGGWTGGKEVKPGFA